MQREITSSWKRGGKIPDELLDPTSDTFRLLLEARREIRQTGHMSPKSRKALRAIYSADEDYMPVVANLATAYAKGSRSRTSH
jgi:hypothetical protein